MYSAPLRTVLFGGQRVSFAKDALRYEAAGLAFDARDMSAVVKGHTTNFDGDANSLFTYSSPSTKYVRNASGLYVSGTTMRCEFDAAGAALGLLIEEQRTNVVLHNRDLTNAAWTKSNVTAAKDQTGIDGVANSASSITATAGNGTCLQAITLASSARYQTAFVKRITGSGAVEMTMDNGSTWTAVTVTSAWTRVSIPTQTLANPTVGFRIVTNGDAVAIDFVQNENGAFETSPIATTTASVTRAADTISLAKAAFPLGSSYSMYADATVQAIGATRSVMSLANGANNEIYMFVSGAGNITQQVQAASAFQGSPNGGAVVASVPVRAAARIATNDLAIIRNGGSLGTDTSVTMPDNANLTGLYLGLRGDATFRLNGWLRQAILVPSAWPDATLAAKVA